MTDAAPNASLGRRAGLLASISLAAALLAGCQVSELAEGAHLAPVPAPLERKIARLGMATRSPILLRIFKEESELEVWKRNKAGKYALLKTYEICAWSGELGPKLKEGDRQAPEGFYTVGPGQMNPNSSYHLAFNIGFPNQFDRSHGRTGSHLMVHGDCSSRGCYAMEDDQIEEIYALAREAFRGGQSAFQVQAFPFRMTPENMARHRDNEHFAFWETLKEGSDHFEVTKAAPKVSVCGRGYVFNAEGSGKFHPTAACPDYTVPEGIEQLVAQKREADLEKRRTAIARDLRRMEREDRWEEREQMIASFFERTRAGTGGADAAGSATAEVDTDEASPVVAEAASASASARPADAAPTAPTQVAGVPVPRRTPLNTTRAEEPRRGLSLPRFFRRDEPTANAYAPTPVASIAARSVPAASTTEPRTPSSTREAAAATGGETQPARSAALGYAPQDEGGFLSSVARGGRGIFNAAGSLFD